MKPEMKTEMAKRALGSGPSSGSGLGLGSGSGPPYTTFTASEKTSFDIFSSALSPSSAR